MNAVNDPICRYYGSKARIAPAICRHLNNIKHSVFVDGCGGGGNVILTYIALGYRAPIMVYNDISNEVVNFFQTLRNKPDDLLRVIRLTPYAREELNRACVTDPLDSDIEMARKFYVRSWQNYSNAPSTTNISWRTDTLSRGRTTISEWISEKRLIDTAEKLRLLAIENIDFREIFERYDGKDAVLFFDPPYLPDVRNRRHRKAYLKEFTEQDHLDLATLAHEAKGVVAITHKRSKKYDELYKGWNTINMVQRGMDKDSSYYEVMYISPGSTIQSKLF